MEYKPIKNVTMKRILFILFAAIMSTTVCHAAMSNSRVRKETRFLTDKMAYELNLNTAQYNDVYEINYDFISGVRYLMDDVLRGEEWALNRYYDYLDVRNDDLRWVLSSRQYSRAGCLLLPPDLCERWALVFPDLCHLFQSEPFLLSASSSLSHLLRRALSYPSSQCELLPGTA